MNNLGQENIFFYVLKEFVNSIFFAFVFIVILGTIINDLVIYNTGISYSNNFNSSSEHINQQKTRELLISATDKDALNFIANFDGTINELQNIQNAVKDAYENHGLSKEYYDTFNTSFNTYLVVNE